jgi:hypothetical protein
LSLLVDHGGTIINGEFIPWLKDYQADVRGKIADIIYQGYTQGKHSEQVQEELKNYLIVEQESRRKLIATNELATLRNIGMDRAYTVAGVEYVMRKLGPNPCPVCAPHRNRIYRFGTQPYMPIHPYCMDYYVPVKMEKGKFIPF